METKINKSQTKSFLVGAFLGAALGSMAALLYAPQKGEAARRRMRERLDKFKKEADKYLDEGKKVVSELSNEVRKSAQETSAIVQDSTKDITQKTKEKIEKVVEKSQEHAGKISSNRKPRYFKGV